jgi:2-polyprenyl-3-methyl-5-hydroxy-6-metoxy-1,4-benzoquinol methylase
MKAPILIPGTEGYASQAKYLVARYESETFEDKHQAILELLPETPSRILDIGSGSGLDAEWFALKGHQVYAVEPVIEQLQAAKEIHNKVPVTWIQDSLPDLATFPNSGHLFDVVMLTAVLMHLDHDSRLASILRISKLLAPNGLLCLTLRHGPTPAGRQMFNVAAEEVIKSAERNGLINILNVVRESVGKENRKLEIMWSHLAFRAV